VDDQVFSSSAFLNELAISGMMTANSRSTSLLSVEGPARGQYGTSADGSPQGHIYLPLTGWDLDSLVAARNLFAFLTNQPLVMTRSNPTIFSAFLNIAALLRQFGFTSDDGSSFGDSVEEAFDLFLDQYSIADVRHSREKTIEGLILAEQMRSWSLYNEAFTHAVGKYEDLLDMKSPLFQNVSASTRNRLERAHIDLVNRQNNVNSRLETFEFPSLFAGVASSTSREEYRNVRFKEWKNSFLKMRTFVQLYYKDLFGNWPPKARSKKNHFSHSGLNRQCLKMLYSDLCALYDLLVDRDSITPRAIDDQVFEANDQNPVDPNISALRMMLTEFDHSSPPVLPPIPYDIPKIPRITAVRENYNELPAKTKAKFDKALQPYELQLILLKSHNIDTEALTMPFLIAFKQFEKKEARRSTPTTWLTCGWAAGSFSMLSSNPSPCLSSTRPV